MAQFTPSKFRSSHFGVMECSVLWSIRLNLDVVPCHFGVTDSSFNGKKTFEAHCDLQSCGRHKFGGHGLLPEGASHAI